MRTSPELQHGLIRKSLLYLPRPTGSLHRQNQCWPCCHCRRWRLFSCGRINSAASSVETGERVVHCGFEPLHESAEREGVPAMCVQADFLQRE